MQVYVMRTLGRVLVCQGGSSKWENGQAQRSLPASRNEKWRCITLPLLAQGLTPLLAALTASSPGVSVVNIDNGACPAQRAVARGCGSEWETCARLYL